MSDDQSQNPYAAPQHDSVSPRRKATGIIQLHMMFWFVVAGCVRLFRPNVQKVAEGFNLDLPALSALLVSPFNGHISKVPGTYAIS
jgi:hypothetical protein